jgi:hypothetical protein
MEQSFSWDVYSRSHIQEFPGLCWDTKVNLCVYSSKTLELNHFCNYLHYFVCWGTTIWYTPVSKVIIFIVFRELYIYIFFFFSSVMCLLWGPPIIFWSPGVMRRQWIVKLLQSVANLSFLGPNITLCGLFWTIFDECKCSGFKAVTFKLWVFEFLRVEFCRK